MEPRLQTRSGGLSNSRECCRKTVTHNYTYKIKREEEEEAAKVWEVLDIEEVMEYV